MPDTALPDANVITAAFWDPNVREQVVTTCLSSGRPSGVEGRVIFETDTERIMAYSGGAWRTVGEITSGWISSTNNVSYGGSLTNVTSEFRYRRLFGSTIEWECAWTLSGAPAAGLLVIASPVAVAAVGANVGMPVGHAFMLDSGTGRRRGMVYADSVATSSFYIDISDAGYASAVSNTIPWSWANTDAGTASGRFRAALG